MFGSSKSGPRIDALTVRVDALELENKAVLKRLLDLESQCATFERTFARHERILKQMGKRSEQDDKDDYESWTKLNEQIRKFVFQFKDLEGKIKTLEMWREHLRRVENEKAAGHPVPDRR
jgi:chromosome segregation ATPase